MSKPPPNEWPMTQCIFCPNLLGPETKPEHVLLNALGGRKTSKTAICSDCNNRFGGSFDKTLAEQGQVFRNLLQLESGTGRPPPMLRTSSVDNVRFRVSSDGTPTIDEPPFSIKQAADGSTGALVRARSVEELRKHIPNIAGALKLSEDEVRDLIRNSGARHIIQRPRLQFNLSFGGLEALRSVTKACLVLLSTKVGSNALRAAPFADARDFVVNGGNAFLHSHIDLDARELPQPESLAAFGPTPNLVYVRSDDAGSVVGYFCLYNAIGWRVSLAASGGPPNEKIGLISDPLEPSNWSDKIADRYDLAPAWLEGVEADYDQWRRRFERLVGQHYERARPAALEGIVAEILARNAIQGGTITEDHVHHLVDDLMHAIEEDLLGSSRERPLTAKEIQAITAVDTNGS